MDTFLKMLDNCEQEEQRTPYILFMQYLFFIDRGVILTLHEWGPYKLRADVILKGLLG